jgi:hypothetical protein
VLDVLVHVDPEDDLAAAGPGPRLPPRAMLEAELQAMLGGLPPPERIVLHYLGGRVEAELFLAHDAFPDIAALRAAEAALAERIKGHPAIRSVSLNFRIAP